MKVTFKKADQGIYTYSEILAGQQIMEDLKEDTSTARECLQMAANAFGYCNRVLEAKAEISGNCRVHDAYGDDTGKMDVWVKGLVHVWTKDGDSYVEIGAYLTDIWALTGQPEEYEELKKHAYYRIYRCEA